MRQFFGVLAFFFLISEPCLATPVNPASPDGVASTFSEGSLFYVLLTDGYVYTYIFEGSEYWQFWGILSSFPLSQISDFRGRYLQKTDGTFWGVRYAQHPANQTTWREITPFPTSQVVPTEQGSLGQMKSLFR